MLCARICGFVFFAGGIVLITPPTIAQSAEPGTTGSPRAREAAPAALEGLSREEIDAAVQESIASIVGMQEGDGGAEWPYEGVYRVGGKIPIGYRVGGTAIAGLALMRAPGFDEDAMRIDAVKRGAGFILAAREHTLMSPTLYDAGYDVRGWGYTYAAQFLLEWRAREAGRPGSIPEDMREEADSAIRWYIDAIQMTEIPGSGGWNYARPPGKDKAAPSSPFMSGPTLQTLFEARRQGFVVDAAIVDRAMDALDRMRSVTGSFVYSGVARPAPAAPEPVPGSVGRMLAAETTLLLGGRGSVERVRGALDSFFTHWEWLDKRRAQQGTHVPPYGVAPYYFYYAHYHAAQAIEMLPAGERREYRRRLTNLIFRNRLEDGTWNDRVFKRSSSFGTSMVVMSLTAPGSTFARWEQE